jgi:hypothetical protein
MAKPIYEDDVSEEEQVSPTKRTIFQPVYEDDSSLEDQIRSAAAERAANKASPTMPAYEETPVSEKTAVKVPMRQGQTSSFKEAFAAARGNGDKTFSYNGKLYATELASSTPKKTSPAPMQQEKAAPISSNEGRNKPSPAKTSMGSDNASAMSVNERIKKSLASAREGSGPTDSRSVNQRIKEALGMKKGGAVKKMASGGSVSSASRRADGIATKGKTRGRIC